MLRVRLQELTSTGKVYVQRQYDTLKLQYNLLYGINHMEKQNELLQNIERNLVECAGRRRDIQRELYEVQDKIRDTRNLIDKTPRNSDNFMLLFTNEHNLIKKEFDLMNVLKFEEEKEREMLAIFSDNIRKAHQIDLVRQSRQRLMSFICSILGGIFGFGVHSFINRQKNEFVSDQLKKQSDELQQLKSMLNSIFEQQCSCLESQQQLQQKLEMKQSYSYLSYLAYPFVAAYRLVF